MVAAMILSACVQKPLSTTPEATQPTTAKFSVGVVLPTKDEPRWIQDLSLIHISEPTRLLSISYAVFCLKKKNNTQPH